MPLTREQKEEQVAYLKDQLGKANAVIFGRNNGLSVSAMADFRSKLREADLECKVAKKTLFRIAASEQGIKDIPADVMEGPVITVFGFEDQAVPAQILNKFAKDSDEKFELLGGILDNEVIDAKKVKYLASLPSKEQLIMQLMGVMNGPTRDFAGTLNGVTSAFVRVMGAYKDKLEEEGGAAPAEEAKADEPAQEEAKEEAKTEDAAPAEEKAEEKPAESEVPAEEKAETEAPKEEVKEESKEEAKDESKQEEASDASTEEKTEGEPEEK